MVVAKVLGAFAYAMPGLSGVELVTHGENCVAVARESCTPCVESTKLRAVHRFLQIDDDAQAQIVRRLSDRRPAARPAAADAVRDDRRGVGIKVDAIVSIAGVEERVDQLALELPGQADYRARTTSV